MADMAGHAGMDHGSMGGGSMGGGSMAGMDHPAMDHSKMNHSTTAATEKAAPFYAPGSGLTPRAADGGKFLSYDDLRAQKPRYRSEEHTSELQSLMRISYAVFCLKKKNTN